MSKYKSKPLIVEAFRLGYENPPDWFTDGMSQADAEFITNNPREGVFLNVHGGSIWVKSGDWICKNQNGLIYAMSDWQFKKAHDAN